MIYRVLWGNLPPEFGNRSFAASAAGCDLGLDDARLALLLTAAEEAASNAGGF